MFPTDENGFPCQYWSDQKYMINAYWHQVQVLGEIYWLLLILLCSICKRWLVWFPFRHLKSQIFQSKIPCPTWQRGRYFFSANMLVVNSGVRGLLDTPVAAVELSLMQGILPKVIRLRREISIIISFG